MKWEIGDKRGWDTLHRDGEKFPFFPLGFVYKSTKKKGLYAARKFAEKYEFIGTEAECKAWLEAVCAMEITL